MWRAPDFGAFRRFSAACLPRGDLAGLLLALERRRIAHPKSQGLRRFSEWDYSRDLRPAKWVSIKLRRKIPELPIRHSGTSAGRSLYPKKGRGSALLLCPIRIKETLGRLLDMIVPGKLLKLVEHHHETSP